MPQVTAEQIAVRNALSVAGVEQAEDPRFLLQIASVLKDSQRLYEQHKGSDWMKATTFGAQQMSRTASFLKAGADGVPLLLMSPGRGSAAVLAIMSQKVAFAAGFASDDERVKCGAALVALAGNTAAMLILGAGTGGLAIALSAVSLGASLLQAHRECGLGDGRDQAAPSSPPLKLH